MPPTRPLDPTEVRLVERAIAGDREAFGDLYERHLAAIYRYVFYRVGEAQEAEDLTETVFLKAWQALNGYRPTEAPFVVWLYRIAHNLLVDRHRTRKELEPLEAHHPDSSSASDPEAQAVAREQRRALTSALARLEPLQQQVLTLRFIGGLSHAETAQITGHTEGAVRVIQHRALIVLRQLLARQVDQQ
jgi:RNA polymerase sigma-70 factor (ECF subfamily)